jgi:quinol monooxygenase YgiN
MSPVILIAKLRAREGMEAQAEAALHECQAGTHQEPGAYVYALHRDDSDPRVFVMIESWEGDAAMDAHVASAHVQALQAKSPEIFDGELEITRLVPLPFGDSGKGAL